MYEAKHQSLILDMASTLFRGTSMATCLMDQYMKMTATCFVHTAVQGTIQKIMDSKLSCEVSFSLVWWLTGCACECLCVCVCVQIFQTTHKVDSCAVWRPLLYLQALSLYRGFEVQYSS